MAQSAPPDTARELLLASSSAHRRALLDRLGLRYRTRVPAIDESPLPNETPLALVRRLSQAKAAAVAPQAAGALVIGSDQVAVNGSHVLGKPGGHAAAVRQLGACSGRTVAFHTGLCVLDAASGSAALEVVTTEVVFRRLTRERIEAYLELERPYDCAGSFKAEGLGIVLFERISSPDPSALTGLPLIALVSLLGRHGVDVLDASVRLTTAGQRRDAS